MIRYLPYLISFTNTSYINIHHWLKKIYQIVHDLFPINASILFIKQMDFFNNAYSLTTKII